MGREFDGAMFGHFQKVWGWKLGRMGGFLLRNDYFPKRDPIMVIWN